MKNLDKGLELLFSFFDESEQLPYQTSHKLISQSNDEFCVAACVQMILADFEINESQYYVAADLETRGGAYPSKVPNVFNEYGIEDYQWKKDLTVAELSEATKERVAIVSLFRKNAEFGHSIIVDAIIDGIVQLRDSLPIGQGKSYAVTLETFTEVWLRSGVIYYVK